jgi:hypothetical protein
MLKPSTENLLFAIQMVVEAFSQNRTDLSDETLTKLMDIRAAIQYLQEIDCE